MGKLHFAQNVSWRAGCVSCKDTTWSDGFATSCPLPEPCAHAPCSCSSASARPKTKMDSPPATVHAWRPARAAAVDDQSSQSNPVEARVVHADLALRVDFGSRRVCGTAALRVRAEVADEQQLRLDTRISPATWQSESSDAAHRQRLFAAQLSRGRGGSWQRRIGAGCAATGGCAAQRASEAAAQDGRRRERRAVQQSA
jgi:hypothetical protein